MTRVTGFLPPIATPFLDGGLDLPSLQRLMEYLVDDVDGYLIGGSVGEVASLTLEERETLIREAGRLRRRARRRRSPSRSPTTPIEHSRRLSDLAGEVGAELLMVSCPNYFTNDLGRCSSSTSARWASSRAPTSASTTIRSRATPRSQSRTSRRSPTPCRASLTSRSPTPRSRRWPRSREATDLVDPLGRRRRAVAPALRAAPTERWWRCR